MTSLIYSPNALAQGHRVEQKYRGIFDSTVLPQRGIVDAGGAFLSSELELIDPQLHLPLSWTTFAQDIEPRQGFTIDTEFPSWTNSTFGSNGTTDAGGKSWLGLEATDTSDMAIDIMKQVNTPGIWAKSASWTYPELSRSQKLQRPIDVDKLDAIQKYWNLEMDNQAYLGDPSKNLYGIANASPTDGNTADWAVQQITAAVTGGWLALYASNPTTAANLILNDLRDLDQKIWSNSQFTSPATKFLIPASVWSILNVPLAIAGAPLAISIKEYFEKFASISGSQGNRCQLVPRKWLVSGFGSNTYGNSLSSNRVVGYVDEYDYIRFEYTPLINTPVWIQGMRQSVTYYGNVGGVEIVYPSTVGYITGV